LPDRVHRVGNCPAVDADPGGGGGGLDLHHPGLFLRMIKHDHLLDIRQQRMEPVQIECGIDRQTDAR